MPLRKILNTIAILLSLVAAGGAQEVLYSFQGGSDGQNPSISGLVFDEEGNIYGTTGWGGAGAYCNENFLGPCGIVYELTPDSNGGWTKTTLYNFCSLPNTLPNCADGQYPLGVVRDSAGNLYGVTSFGGANDQSADGAGVVFELTPNGSGWTESVLYNFCSLQNCIDGEQPGSNLIIDGKGNLYGTTYAGGSSNRGTVFKLSRSGSGWTLTTLHSFSGSDGVNPSAPLLLGNGGLFGTTPGGGAHGEGVVFEISSSSGGPKENVLYSFTGKADGGIPAAPLIFDTTGNLYGTAEFYGGHNKGVAFELVRGSSGTWTYALIHAFAGGTDGAYPEAGLLIDGAGDLYGTTTGGGGTGCEGVGCGTIFGLTPITGGGWTETIQAFSGTDGSTPQDIAKKSVQTADEPFDHNVPGKRGCPGGCYGTTYGGGASGFGVVFQAAH